MSPRRAAERVIAYIDGFNLYYGLRAARYQRYYWLDLVALARNLLRRHQVLVCTKYFTARIAGPKPADSPAKKARLREKRKRQTTWLDALATLPDLRIFEGHYLARDMRCRRCGAEWTSHEEKMTDVNIATELLLDAFNDAFDTTLLVSGDSDLVAPVRAVRQRFRDKRVVVAFPPRRRSGDLCAAASACITIGRATLARSLLPETVTTPAGHRLRRPSSWT